MASSQQENVINVTCEQSFKLLQEHKDDPDFVIVDLRTKAMFEAERIENAIQFDVFSTGFDEWIKKLDKEKTYLIYCNAGKRSSVAVQKMKILKFNHIYHLFEGLQEWKANGLATIKEKSDLELVKKAINAVFGWAINKDFDLFFNTISDDSNFVSVTPYKRVKIGIQAVKNDTAFWANPNFKAISHDLYNLRINFSEDGTVAWFYCLLDDINTWEGEPANWEKVRWTGVLEKRKEKWRIVQQHFSWPKKGN